LRCPRVLRLYVGGRPGGSRSNTETAYAETKETTMGRYGGVGIIGIIVIVIIVLFLIGAL
jgi:hypothetical protein